MNQALSEDQFAAFIGIDWADVKHDVCLLAVGSDEIEFSTLTHTPEAIAAWSSSLYQRFGGKPVAICLELDKGPLVYALREYPFLVVFPVNPLMLARFREAFATSGAKDDPSDARLQLELLLKHRDRLRPLNPSSPAIQALELLVKHQPDIFMGDGLQGFIRCRYNAGKKAYSTDGDSQKSIHETASWSVVKTRNFQQDSRSHGRNGGDRLKPLAVFENRNQHNDDCSHCTQDTKIAIVPGQLGHELEIHTVDTGKQGEWQEDHGCNC